MADEDELKFKLSHAAATRRRMRALGLRVSTRRRREENWVFDDARGNLRRRGELLRLRRSGRRWLLTVKGKRRQGPLKRRPEFETEVADGAATRALLKALGFEERLAYGRYRTSYTQSGGGGELAWDETPMGIYIELEGPAAWIRATAKGLGLALELAEARSYPELYAVWRGRR